jgi:hypothetical protein
MPTATAACDMTESEMTSLPAETRLQLGNTRLGEGDFQAAAVAFHAALQACPASDGDSAASARRGLRQAEAGLQQLQARAEAQPAEAQPASARLDVQGKREQQVEPQHGAVRCPLPSKMRHLPLDCYCNSGVNK